MSTQTPAPTYTEAKSLHQLILRWDANGVIAEAHTTWHNHVIKNGERIASIEEKAPLVVGDGSADNLTKVLGELHVSSLATIQQLQGDVTKHQAEIAALKAQLEAKG